MSRGLKYKGQELLQQKMQKEIKAAFCHTSILSLTELMFYCQLNLADKENHHFHQDNMQQQHQKSSFGVNILSAKFT